MESQNPQRYEAKAAAPGARRNSTRSKGRIREKIGVELSADDKKITILLDSKFATAEETAKALGVPRKRLRWLKRLASAETVFAGRKLSRENGTGVSAPAKKTKKASGRAKKAAR